MRRSLFGGRAPQGKMEPAGHGIKGTVPADIESGGGRESATLWMRGGWHRARREMRVTFGVVASGIDWFLELLQGLVTFPSMFLAALASWLLWHRYRFRFHPGGTVLGVIGLELLVLCLSLTDWSENLWDTIPLLFLSGVICSVDLCSVTCFLYSVWNPPTRRLTNGLAALFIVVAAGAWWFAGRPLATHLRVCRHYRELKEKLPAFNALASQVECFRNAAGRTPEESAFWQLESRRRKEDDRLRSSHRRST
jgi:hypothetical protein